MLERATFHMVLTKIDALSFQKWLNRVLLMAHQAVRPVPLSIMMPADSLIHVPLVFRIE